MAATRGTPLQGSRAAHDVTDPDLHASDIEDAAFTVHNDPAAAEGEAMVMGAAGAYEATDVLTPSEHTAIGDGAPHHAAVTLAADHGLGLTGQELSMGTPSTLTAATTNAVTTTTHTHEVTGFAVPGDLHDAVTLGVGSDAALALVGQELTLTLPAPAALADHDHSGDAGDGGTFDAANLTAGASTDGQVLTSDGAGAAAWESLPALADHTHAGVAGDGGLIALLQGAEGAVDGISADVRGGQGLTGDGGVASLNGGVGDVDGGDAVAAGGFGTSGNGGDVILLPGEGGTANGHVVIEDPTEGTWAILDTSGLVASRTYTFPDATGTLALVGTGGGPILPLLAADPVAPTEGEAWVRRTATATGTPIGLLLALTHTLYTRELSVYDSGAVYRMELTIGV